MPDKAKELYSRFHNAEPVDLSVTFWRAGNVGFKTLTKSLADFS